MFGSLFVKGMSDIFDLASRGTLNRSISGSCGEGWCRFKPVSSGYTISLLVRLCGDHIYFILCEGV